CYHSPKTCNVRRVQIRKASLIDQGRDLVLQVIHFDALIGSVPDYHLYALLAPHLENHGSGNHGWTGTHKGTPMLFAQRGGTTLALACSSLFKAMSCGYVGFSDGWQDNSATKRMPLVFDDAPDRKIALH